MDEDVKESFIFPIIRHVLQAGGTVLVTTGTVNAEDGQMIIGAVVSLAAVFWGVCKRRGMTICQK